MRAGRRLDIVELAGTHRPRKCCDRRSRDSGRTNAGTHSAASLAISTAPRPRYRARRRHRCLVTDPSPTVTTSCPLGQATASALPSSEALPWLSRRASAVTLPTPLRRPRF